MDSEVKRISPGSASQMFGEIFAIIFILWAAMRVVSALLARVSDILGGRVESSASTFWAFFVSIWPLLMIVAVAFSAMLLIAVVHFSRKMSKIWQEERIPLYPEVATAGLGASVMKNEKWDRVEKHINTTNPSDWKLAILEADILLDDLLDRMGYQGDTMGEKMKKIERSDFNTIDLAWEAHKVRNQIAHEGAEFLITEREAHRVVDLYREVFEEFKFI